MTNTPDDSLKRATERASHGRQQPEGVLVIRTIAMPADTNPAGDIFGGWLMSQMDLAAGNIAGRVSQGRSATVAVEGMQFLRPVKVGDEVTLYGTLKKVGRTSMHIHVDVWARARFAKSGAKVTAADFVFVALDEDGNPRPIEEE
ncbi:acyl-CoA thioesterase [Pseudoprimorskyibacter insulae]|uniref:Putative acyl-CoA thioester hydrolase n=1 Tax=Pseudoprimorskyibacter insulae TaxID=1695997 RepID=A0A2R8AXW9_9RHOB|nr:acyl-CoA thioesterase [Pseudoprimorskyibacter insulae]SPF80850.1 putative acyl-CoA thioester hydrolase [Pseudoprimorskyibacter insulae]